MKKILVIDDDGSVSRAVRQCLAAQDYLLVETDKLKTLYG